MSLDISVTPEASIAPAEANAPAQAGETPTTASQQMGEDRVALLEKENARLLQIIEQHERDANKARADAEARQREHEATTDQMYAKTSDLERQLEALTEMKKTAQDQAKENQKLNEMLDRMIAEKYVVAEDQRRYATLLKWFSVQAFVKEHKTKKRMRDIHTKISQAMMHLMEEEQKGAEPDRDPCCMSNSDYLPSDTVPLQSEIEIWTRASRRLQTNGNANVKELLGNLCEVEHVLSTSVDELRRQKQHWRKLADRLFERNNELNRKTIEVVARSETKETENKQLIEKISSLEKQLAKSNAEMQNVKEALVQSKKREKFAETKASMLTHKIMEQSVALDLLEIKSPSQIVRTPDEDQSLAAPSRQNRSASVFVLNSPMNVFAVPPQGLPAGSVRERTAKQAEGVVPSVTTDLKPLTAKTLRADALQTSVPQAAVHETTEGFRGSRSPRKPQTKLDAQGSNQKQATSIAAMSPRAKRGSL